MPWWKYSDPVTARTYPETRDAAGRHLGTVQPGDVREFSEAPDQWWALAEPEAASGDAQAGEPEQAGTPDHPAGASETAAPAAAPAPRAKTTGT